MSYKRKKQLKVNNTLKHSLLAATAAAALTVSSSPALAAMGSERPVPAAQTAKWLPPEGYTYETSFVGSSASCTSQGATGVAEGRWSAFVCHEEMMKLTDNWMLFQSLYAKK